MNSPSFWDDQDRAKKIVKKVNVLKSWTQPYFEIANGFNDLNEFFKEAKETKDEKLISDLTLELEILEKKLEELEIKKMLSHELDPKSCFLSINAGAGGTESCDWANMLFRMYERYATKRGWKVAIIDKVDGDVTGIKSVTLKFEGDFAYGYTKSEKGVHRLVRISPFDASKKRHTSFASVAVSPIIDEDIEVDIQPQDIRVDTFRASGAGGQHVNVTDSAVRITHIKTGIVVTSQSERSQVQNRQTCMELLKSKLYEKEIFEREEKISKIGGEKKKIEWGSQIRSYVFQPYTLVKDTRTKYETSNVTAVLDGELDEFVKAYLKEFS
ncbi:MAG: Peptide chain release factor 2 [Candidatus Anoxychlamydiales bacterium]|nr:Peptide chain release factor 2 [Candidatus Anoxychlamydiales bacterium]